MTKPRPVRPLPTRQQLLDYIASSPVRPDERALLRAFKVAPADRVRLKGLIKSIARGAQAGEPQGRPRSATTSRAVMGVVEFAGLDAGGDLKVRVLADSTIVPVKPGKVGRAERLGPGERAVARLEPGASGALEAALLRRLDPEQERVVGVFRAEGEQGGRIEPADRRDKTTYRVRAEEALGAVDGELVEAVPLPLARLGLPHAQILSRIGRPGDPGAISLLAIRRYGIPSGFSDAALAEAGAARPVPLGDRIDLRDVPLVTIDGADARDFDDAVWAEPDPDTTGGWQAIVAIADVAHYVTPGSALDDTARDRGNSVYFPDRVVPMLPEALSNELCSLKPGVDRACLAVRLWIDGDGTLVRHRFERALMRSAARLTYEAVQAAIDGQADPATEPLVEPVLRPLYGVFASLDRARRQRGTLDLDLPERRVVLGPDGRIARIERRQRLDSHRLIEELMIAANVAAAETLEAARTPALYRVHDAPDPARLDALRLVLAEIGVAGLTLAKGQVVRPAHFARLLDEAAGLPEADLVNEMVLRAQAQAQYAPGNIGHFGLSLRRYAHFTSPIRRYADLAVHRALIASRRLGDGGATEAPAALEQLGKHLSAVERRAAQAERGALDRYVAAFMADRVGEVFAGRVSGVQRFGLFVTLDDSGADGLIPIGRLPADYYHHDAERQSLEGRRTRQRFRLGDRVEVRLDGAQPLTGGIEFTLADGEPGRADRPSRRGPPRAVARKPRLGRTR